MSPTAPEKLYFYCSTKEAVDVLESKTLPWITPAVFDGVTELNPDSRFSFDKDQLIQSTIKIACSLIFGPEAPKGQSPLVNAICRWRDSERFADAQEAQLVLRELCAKLVDQRFAHLTKSLEHWSEACHAFHILRLFHSVDNFQVWDKYGQNGKGVAIELRVGNGCSLATPHSVHYQEYLPEITSLKQQISGLVYGKESNPDKHLEKRFLNRPLCYKKEQEWRYFINMANRANATIDNTYHPINPSEITTLFFGPAISAQDKDLLTSALHESAIQPQIKQSNFTKGRFELHHTEIGVSAEQVAS